LQVKNRTFRAGMRGWVGGAVGGDAQVLVEIARTGADISVGRYSSTAVPLMLSEVTAVPRRSAKQLLGPHCLKQAQRGNGRTRTGNGRRPARVLASRRIIDCGLHAFAGSAMR
jgi:hypothetical protein